jgi:2-polyprenyl-6-methoxyphenol hydroxylase-like FAD-dependent oxidoreductase
LSDGAMLSADLVAGCDGPHSAVRRLVFARGTVRQAARRVQRVVHCTRHRRVGWLVCDVSGTRSQRVDATVS